MARGRAAAAGPPVPAGAHPRAAAAVAVVLRRPRGAAARGGVAGRLLGRRLLLRAHDPAPAADVRRAVADRRGRAMAAAAGRAARPVWAQRDPRRAGRRLVPAAARTRRPAAAALGIGGPVQRGDDRVAPARAVRPGRAEPGRAHLADARDYVRRRGAVLAAVHPVAAVPPPDAAAVPV